MLLVLDVEVGEMVLDVVVVMLVMVDGPGLVDVVVVEVLVEVSVLVDVVGAVITGKGSVVK